MTVTVSQVADLLELKPQANGKWHGAPKGTNTTKDGFILCPEGHAFTNGGDRYTSREVAELAGIDPGDYEPVADWQANNSGTNGAAPMNREARRKSAPKVTPKAKPNRAGGRVPFDWARAQTFDYCDEGGALLYQVGRIGDGAAKQIRQRRPDPDRRGAWLYSLEGARRVLWLLPKVATAQTVFICEGEKSATALNEALEAAGLSGDHVATTNAQGAGKWEDEFCEALEGAAVCVLPDNDGPGDAHGAAICASIEASGRAVELKRLDLPELPEKGDVADFIEAGGTVARLLQLLEGAPKWKAPAKPSRLIPIGDLRKRPAPKWLIQRFLVQRATSLFTADSGSYKSFVALHIAYSVAHGMEFFGRGVRAGAVVYVAGEGGDGIRARSMAWDIHHNRKAPPNLFIWESAVQIANASEVAAFLAELEAAGVKPALIIFDTLNRCAEGLEENSAKDMGIFCAGLEKIKRATGAHVNVVHHNNAGGKSRGSTALPGAFETRFSAEREGQIVTLRCQKQKDGAAEFEAFALEAQSVEIGELDEYGDPITSLVLEQSDLVPKSEIGRANNGAKSRTCEAILKQLATLQEKASDGATVSKTEWEEAVTGAGVCSRSVFYLRVKELEGNRWQWVKGDCQLLEREAESEIETGEIGASPKSPKSPKSDVSDASENRKSEKSEKSDSTVGSRTYRTNRTNPAQTAQDTGKTQTPKHRAAAESEPYATAGKSSSEAAADALEAMGVDEF